MSPFIRRPCAMPLLAIACLLAVAPASPGQSGRFDLNDEQRFGAFTIRVYRAPADVMRMIAEVSKNGRVLFSRHIDWGAFVIGNDINKGGGDQLVRVPAIPVGTDITGLGKPNVILAEWTGGAHCCFVFHVLELAERVREVATVDARDADGAHFEDVDHDGVYEFVGWDFAFAYWHAAFLQSPAPLVILRFHPKRGYQLAPELMRRPPPSDTELNQIEKEIRESEWEGAFPPPLLWGTMLHLIYTGHAALAWKLVPDVWQPGAISQRQFLRDFCKQLAGSRYFPGLRPELARSPCR